jgi:predicted nucleotidyltransferase
MREKIINGLSRIENKHGIHILYACEAGSRAYGTETAESDYDVRFIFMRPLRAYVSIVQSGQTISDNTEMSIEYHGWDIFKALQLCQKSNPSLYEWFMSPFIYRKDEFFYKKMRQIIYSSYSLETLFKHYQSLAIRNIKELRRKEAGSKTYVKTFLQALRATLTSRWIAKHQSLPPLLLKHLADGDQNIEDLIELLVKAKTVKECTVHLAHETILEEIIDSELDKFQHIADRKTVDVQRLNEVVWGLFNI